MWLECSWAWEAGQFISSFKWDALTSVIIKQVPPPSPQEGVFAVQNKVRPRLRRMQRTVRALMLVNYTESEARSYASSPYHHVCHTACSPLSDRVARCAERRVMDDATSWRASKQGALKDAGPGAKMRLCIFIRCLFSLQQRQNHLGEWLTAAVCQGQKFESFIHKFQPSAG